MRVKDFGIKIYISPYKKEKEKNKIGAIYDKKIRSFIPLALSVEE